MACEKLRRRGWRMPGSCSDQIKVITAHRSLAEVAHHTLTAHQQRPPGMKFGAEGEGVLSDLPTRLDDWGLCSVLALAERAC